MLTEMEPSAPTLPDLTLWAAASPPSGATAYHPAPISGVKLIIGIRLLSGSNLPLITSSHTGAFFAIFEYW
jgi:hypothetical protein